MQKNSRSITCKKFSQYLPSSQNPIDFILCLYEMKTTNKKPNNTSPSSTSTIKWGVFTFGEHNAASHESFGSLNPANIQNALNSDCNYFAVVQQPKDFKVPSGVNIQPENSSSHAVVISDFKQKSFVLRMITGSDIAKDSAHCILLNKEALKILNSDNIVCDSIIELQYHLKKSLINIEYHFGSQSPRKTEKFLKIRSRAISQFSAYFFTKNASPQKWLFMALALVGFFHITSTSQKAGISGDEFIQHEYGRVIANYHLQKFGSGIPIDTLALKGQKMNTLAREYPNIGKDIATIEDPEKLMHLYGSSFDTFNSLLIHWFDVENYMEFRHFWNSVFGWLIFLFVALIARRLTHGSWLWASIAFVLVYFTPRIFGEALNNPKDIPFALGYVMSLYYAMKVFKNFPHYRTWDLIGLVFGIALGISIRIGGLLFIGITGIYMGLKFIESIGLKNFIGLKWKGLTVWLTVFISSVIAAYIIGVYVWPYGWKAPIDNPMKALSAFTDFQVSLRQLFEGVLYDSDNLPSYYLSKYILITLPIGILLGLVLYFPISIVKRKSYTTEEFLLFFAAVFPIFYIFYQGSSVYGGLRHILFTLPGFVLLGTLGYYKLSNWLPKSNITGPVIALLPALFPVSFVLKNQNLSYMYFNETIGGIEGAYGNYELDYYLASLKPSSDYLSEQVLSKNPYKEFKIVSYGMDQVKYYLRNHPNAKVGFTRYDDRSEKSWDYAVFYNAYMDQHRLQNGYYPPTGTVFAPEIDGKAVGCVVKRPSLNDYKGIQALLKENNNDSCIGLLKSYCSIDSISSEVYFYIANAYANKRMDDSALYYAEKSNYVFKENSRTLFLTYQIHMRNNRTKEAIATMDSYINSRPKDPDGYIMKGQAQLYSKDYYSAIATVSKAIPFNPFDERIYSIGAQCYQGLKDNANTQLWYKAAILKQAKNQEEQGQSIQSIQNIYQTATGEEMDLSKYFR